MKKLFTGIMVFLVSVCMSLSGVFAYNVDEAISKVSSYYQTSKDVSGAIKHIIAAEALGIDVDSQYKLPEGFGTITDESSTNDIATTVIAEVLMGNDPKNINGKDLVALIESRIGQEEYTDTVSYMVLALYVTNSKELDGAIENLLSFQNADGSFGYMKNTTSLDSTALALEALSLVGKNQEASQIVNYFNCLLQEDGHYKLEQDYGYGAYDAGANIDTQSVIVAALKANGQSISDNQINYILNYQLSDGSFKSDYSEGETDLYATQDATRALGTYKNGSVFKKAKEAYQDIISQKSTTEDKPTEQPNNTEEKQPTINTNSQTTNKDNTNTQTNNTTNKTKAVKTNDHQEVFSFGLMMLVSGIVLYRNKHEVER